MVAYSFKRMFVTPIRCGEKRQTIRMPRRRQARPGEPVQLYCGMRTKGCFKILDTDPVCWEVADIMVSVSACGQAGGYLEPRISIRIFDEWLDDSTLEAFAVADGFSPRHVFHDRTVPDGMTARHCMANFWKIGNYDMQLIRWKPAYEA